MSDRPQPPPKTRRLRGPARALAVALGLALAMSLLPVGWVRWMKGMAAAALRPAQQSARDGRAQAASLVGQVGSHFQNAQRAAELESQLAALREENRRLADELAGSRLSTGAAPAAGQSAQRLLQVRGVEARVLGRQAMAFLGRRHLLDVGSDERLEPESLVVAGGSKPVIDRGGDARLTPGQLVLSDHRVWGRIVEVGPYTSVVRPITAAGYRDVVRLVSPESGRAGLRRGPEGMLEGTGQAQARIRLVAVTEPIAVGDLVYSADDKAFLPEPLWYGRVVRVERPAGAAQWDIWMEPAVDAASLEQVTVLQTELNPLRVAAGQATRKVE
jgi:cell shape-determining protein MreC